MMMKINIDDNKITTQKGEVMSKARIRVELRRSDDNPQRGQENLVRAFNRAVDQSRIKHECRERAYYEKPSDKKRRKLKQRLYQIELAKREALRPSREVVRKKVKKF